MDEAVKRERIDVGLRGKGPVHAVGRAVVARPGLLHPLGLIPKLAAGHVPAEEDIADGPVGLGATNVGDAEALGHLLAQRLSWWRTTTSPGIPEEVLVLHQRGTGFNQDQGENVVLLTEEVGEGRGLGNRIGAISKELLVTNEAGGVRAVVGDGDRLNGDGEPLGAAVQQGELD